MNVLTVLIFSVALLAAFGQPLAGLFYSSREIFLGIYLVRESWIFPALAVVFAVAIGAFRSSGQSREATFALGLYILLFMFLLLLLLTDPMPSVMIGFLQLRNIFGFALALFFVQYCERRIPMHAMLFLRNVVLMGVLSYVYLEVYFVLQNGELISNVFFNKEALEGAKGTRADVGGGLLASFRIPGPLFNPSQLGIFCVYMLYLASIRKDKFRVILAIGLLICVLLGFSKSAFVMLAFLCIIHVFGRQVCAIGLCAFMFAPFALDLLAPVLPDYHIASITRHFEGYLSAVYSLGEAPFGTGIGSAGELATTLGGFEAAIGFESGLGTIIANLGVFGIVLYTAIGIYCFSKTERVYFDFFALWSASMYFNEAGLSPHLFVFQFITAAVVLRQSRSRPVAPVRYHDTPAMHAI